ncbi:MA3 DOMAIN-CONTAINING TRANSLATION REGULATORY FACTOR 3-like [Tasmannia lanceolata]|uniref:MA3 DOMAIN-CONTAINING TRANSLATION REGULATORY FACTOR 3-like n=1 Tax=Tasmannia lanceolata TaxID=3420 RepID=UPI004063930B
MMEFNDGFLSEEHQELLKSVSESVDPMAVSPLEVSTSPRSPKTHHGKQGSNRGSPAKHDRHSHSGRDGRPKKGGSGGKGTWGGLLDTGNDCILDPNDPNYDSNEENLQLNASKSPGALEDDKKKVTVVVEEYFATDDVISTANELRDLGSPGHAYYFVKNCLLEVIVFLFSIFPCNPFGDFLGLPCFNIVDLPFFF